VGSALQKGALKRGADQVCSICSEHRKPLLRFASVVGVIVLGTLFVTFFRGVPDEDTFKSVLHADNPWSVAAFIPVAILLQSSFVPNPALAAIAGVLYGTMVGVPVAIVATIGAACFQLFVGRQLLGEHMRRDLAQRFKRIDCHIEREGWLAVMYTRILPGPTTLIHYAAGGTRVSYSHIALDNLLGAAPKTAAYVILGGSLSDLTSWPVYAALAIIVVFATGGALIARTRLAD
jgi:uncharacterized membrane protein YdjX (TVP38/TMEM64 family)